MTSALIVVLALTGATQSPGSIRAYPPRPYVSMAACPGELCHYGDWTACGTLRVFAAERDTTKMVFTISKGESFVALTGNVHVLRPGLVRVRHHFEIEIDSLSLAFAPGDSIWLLDFGGEGGHMIWYQGKVSCISEDYWCCPESQGRPEDNPVATLVRDAETEWWVRIKDLRGRLGWLRVDGGDISMNRANDCGWEESPN